MPEINYKELKAYLGQLRIASEAKVKSVPAECVGVAF